MQVLKLENLSKYYTSSSSVVMGLSSVSLSFSIGEFVAITGESGSGKSTLAHVLSGILPYEAGELYVYGHPTSHYDASDWENYRRDTVSFISQNYGILSGNTVLENVVSALRLSGISPENAVTAAEKILTEVELLEFKNRRAEKLSSGQKQRLSIARALAKPSKILIADEPTGNLDRENSEKIIHLLKKASADRLVLLITHEFDEAKDAATRRIILSDGLVVTDARLAPVPSEQTTESKSPVRSAPKSPRALSPYIFSLLVRSRPVFTAILCLLLALTTCMIFVFLGTFTVALDDTNTKIYNPSVFGNGDSRRLVVMKDGGVPFTEKDYADILTVKFTDSIEKRGYINDINYYYRPEIDYHLYQDIVNGPNYHPVTNPEDYEVTNLVKFIESDPLFLRTVPTTAENFSIEGRLPEGVYEVLSADPSLHIGDTVQVYFRNQKDWNLSSYISISFEVVGTTNAGEGLYFSDKFGAMMTYGVKSATGGYLAYIRAPYDPTRFTVVRPADTSFPALDPRTVLIPESSATMSFGIDSIVSLDDLHGEEHLFTCVGTFDATYSRLLLISPEEFETFTDLSPSNQISLYIKDYAYADRVLAQLGDMGYIAISPFRLGATETDEVLALERTVTLAVCLAATVLTVILQLILLRAMFSSLHDHLRLLYNIGLTAQTAYRALAIIFVVVTLIGECLGSALIVILNQSGVERVFNIFKHLESGPLVLLFLTHFLSVIPAFFITLRSVQKTVFAQSKPRGDIDFSAMEEVTVHD